MNTRITCLLLFVIAHASATAAPKFPLTLYAAGNALTWSPDGKILASSDAQTIGGKFVIQLLLWDAVGWGREPKERITGDFSQLFFIDPDDSNRLGLIFRPDVGKPSQIGILNLKRPKDKPRIIGQKNGDPVAQPGSPHWSPDGKQIAFHRGGEISIVDTVSGDIRHTLNADKAKKLLKPHPLKPGHFPVGQVAGWSPDGKYLVTNSRQGIVVFDAKLEKELFRFDYPRPAPRGAFYITNVAWNPNGTEIAFSVEDTLGRHELNFLDMKGLGANGDPKWASSRFKRKSDRKFTMKDEKGQLIQVGTTLLAWDPQGRRIAVIRSGKSVIYVYNKGGALLHELAIKSVLDNKRPGAQVASLAWSPDGFKIAAKAGRTIRVFKTSK